MQLAEYTTYKDLTLAELNTELEKIRQLKQQYVAEGKHELAASLRDREKLLQDELKQKEKR